MNQAAIVASPFFPPFTAIPTIVQWVTTAKDGEEKQQRVTTGPTDSSLIQTHFPSEHQRALPSQYEWIGITVGGVFFALWSFGFFQLWSFGILGFITALGAFIPLFYVLGGYGSKCPSCGVFWARNLLMEEELEADTYLLYYKCKLCAHKWEKTVKKGGDGCGCD